MKTLGIILAGGRSSRLFPATLVATKQLLPIYDKPLIYYPLTTLMLIGIRDYVIITTSEEQSTFAKLFKDAQTELGINITFAVQSSPRGIADAFNVVQSALDTSKFDRSVLILGDNIFYGSYMTKMLSDINNTPGAGMLLKQISARDAHKFGIAYFNPDGSVSNIVEKPVLHPTSNDGLAYPLWMITGLYSFPNDVYQKVQTQQPSARGELEITDLLAQYLNEGRLSYTKMLRGMILFDTGTPTSLSDAANFVRGLQDQNVMVGSPHEVAYSNKWITEEQLLNTYRKMPNTEYGRYLKDLTC